MALEPIEGITSRKKADAALPVQDTTTGGAAGRVEREGGLTLSRDNITIGDEALQEAREEEEEKKKAEEARKIEEQERAEKQQKIEELQKKIDELTKKIEEEKNGDFESLKGHMAELQSLLKQMEELAGEGQGTLPQVPGAGEAPPIPGGGALPAGGGVPVTPAGAPIGGGAPGGGGEVAPAGGASPVGAPPADPNAQIPDYGANPSKTEVGKMLDAAAQKYGIPSDILKAVAWKESGWNNNAVGDGGQSHGIMQIYSEAHPDYNVAEGQRNPAYNIEYGARFLKGLYDRYGNWQEAVKHYNGSGPQAEAYSRSVMQIAQVKPWGAYA